MCVLPYLNIYRFLSAFHEMIKGLVVCISLAVVNLNLYMNIHFNVRASEGVTTVDGDFRTLPSDDESFDAGFKLEMEPVPFSLLHNTM